MLLAYHFQLNFMQEPDRYSFHGADMASVRAKVHFLVLLQWRGIFTEYEVNVGATCI